MLYGLSHSGVLHFCCQFRGCGGGVGGGGVPASAHSLGRHIYHFAPQRTGPGREAAQGQFWRACPRRPDDVANQDVAYLVRGHVRSRLRATHLVLGARSKSPRCPPTDPPPLIPPPTATILAAAGPGSWLGHLVWQSGDSGVVFNATTGFRDAACSRDGWGLHVLLGGEALPRTAAALEVPLCPVSPGVLPSLSKSELHVGAAKTLADQMKGRALPPAVWRVINAAAATGAVPALTT